MESNELKETLHQDVAMDYLMIEFHQLFIKIVFLKIHSPEYNSYKVNKFFNSKCKLYSARDRK